MLFLILACRLIRNCQVKRFQLFPVFRPAGDNVDPGRVDIFMPKDIRQTRDILFFFIKSTGKQVS